MAYKMVLDTETTDLAKCFCYDLGYVIFDEDTGDTICEKHYVIEQVWHNLPLFESAYYKDKRVKYISLMRGHKATLTKWGYAMREMRRDMKSFNITDVYAYNSDFDDKVFAYNCDWYKVENPLDNVGIYDIWGYASQFITGNDDYKDFCEVNGFFTETGNYKGSAEVVYRFLTQDVTFEEMHMGLYDSQIEAYVLKECIKRGADYENVYKVEKVLKRPQEKHFTIKINGKKFYSGKYIKKYVRDDMYCFTEKGV